MKDSELSKFIKTLSGVLTFYGKDINDFTIDVWWESLKAYDLAAVQSAFSRHAVNPDNGQFAPKPADIVRMIGGTSGDAALVAWSKVERAVRSIGQYESLIFDDALIHRVIEDMGGWVKLCSYPTEEAFTFAGKEFQTRYRGFAMRSERPPYPRAMIGHAQAQNQREGAAAEVNYRMLGDPDKCVAVFRGGGEGAGGPVALLRASSAAPRLSGPGAR